MKRLTYIFFILLYINCAVASEDILSDPLQEKRAQDMFATVRCPTCSAQSVKDSNSDAAINLRILIREQIAHGASDKEVLNHLRAKYGDSITFHPPIIPKTILLWLIPIFILGMGCWV